MNAVAHIRPATAQVIADAFELFRVRDFGWHDAKPEKLGTFDSGEAAMDEAMLRFQPKAHFFIRRTYALTGKVMDSFYQIRTTSKHGLTRPAYDGHYFVREKGHKVEHLFDVAMEGWR
jgi:hypothetical protein